MVQVTIIKAICFLGVLSSVLSLEHYDNFRESSCSEIGQKHPPLTNLDRQWLGTLTYYSGSKYQMYRQAYAHPHYDDLREDEFYYDFCLRRNTSVENGVGVFTGFGQNMAIFDVRLRPDRPDILYEAYPRNLQTQDFSRIYVTLTDHKTFAFMDQCWVGSNGRGWNLVSNVPTLPPATVKMIEEHAVELGYKRENFVFLRYDSCRTGNPLTDYINTGERLKSGSTSSNLRRNLAIPTGDVRRWKI